MKIKLLVLGIMPFSAFAGQFPHADCTLSLEQNLKLDKSQMRILKKKGFKLKSNASMQLSFNSSFNELTLKGVNELPVEIAGKTFEYDEYVNKKGLSNALKRLNQCEILTDEYLNQDCPQISGSYQMIETSNDYDMDSIEMGKAGFVFTLGEKVKITQNGCKSFQIESLDSQERPGIFDLNALQVSAYPLGGSSTFESDSHEFRIGSQKKGDGLSCSVEMGLPGCSFNRGYSEMKTISLSNGDIVIDGINNIERKPKISKSILKRLPE